MYQYSREDIAKKISLSGITSGSLSAFAVLFDPGTLAVLVYRFGRFAKDVRLPLVGHLLKALYFACFYLVQMFTGISIQAYADIGPRFVVMHFSCVFVVAEKIGSDFTVYEGVTVGNIRGKSRLPIIGNNVTLEAGCKVLGDVTIGDNVVVRANSLVLSDIPSNSIAVGNPARHTPMKQDIKNPDRTEIQHSLKQEIV
ncbi:MAG: serine O-acetyltransferase [Methylosarcina sp.]